MFLCAAVAVGFPTTRLRYIRGKGAEQCPEVAALRTEVERRLGYDPFVMTADKTIVVSIERVSGQLTGRVELIDGGARVRGLRSVSTEADRCEDLISTLALTISLAIDPASAAGPSAAGPAAAGPSAAGPAAAGPVAAAAPVAAGAVASEGASGAPRATSPAAADAGIEQGDASAEAGPPREPPRANLDIEDAAVLEPHGGGEKATPAPWALGIGAFGSYHVDPGFAAGVLALISGRVGTRSLSLEVRRDLFSSHEDSRFQSDTVLWNIVPCLHREPIFGCLVVAPGVFFASKDRTTGSAFFMLAGARVGGEIPLWRQLGLQLHLDTLLPILRPNVATGTNNPWEAPLLSASLASALVWHFR